MRARLFPDRVSRFDMPVRQHLTVLTNASSQARAMTVQSRMLKRKVVGAPGIEPGSAWCPTSASTCVASFDLGAASHEDESAAPSSTWFSFPATVEQRSGNQPSDDVRDPVEGVRDGRRVPSLC